MSDMINSLLWSPFYTDRSNAPANDFVVTRNPNSDLDKNAFLQLLITQMRFQDPLNPVDDKEFLAQMAQFTALEQMQNMNATNQKSQAFSMIGKNIVPDVYNPLTYTIEEVIGQVSSVIIRNGEPMLVVNGRDVLVSDVVEVYEPYQMQSIYSSLATSQNMALIGKYIQAITVDGNFNPTGFVEGMVDSVRFSGGQTLLVVGGKEVFAPEVISIGNEMLIIGRDITCMIRSGEDYTETRGIITSVKLDASDAYLVVNGKEVKIDKLNYVSEARAYIGKTVNYEKVSGTASEIVIKDQITYLKIITVPADDDREEEYVLAPFAQIRGK